MKEKIVLLGSGQHANVVIYNIEMQEKYEVACIISPEYAKGVRTFRGIPVVGTDNDRDFVRREYGTNKFFIGFGDMNHRKRVFEMYTSEGWEAVNVLHPSAIVSKDAKIGKGVLIEAGCLVTPNPIIGDNVVVNTGSQVNHDNIIENHVYIASGVILSGGVHIKENTLLDDGVIITLGTEVASNSIIGAGAVVAKDIKVPGKYVGVPARKI